MQFGPSVLVPGLAYLFSAFLGLQYRRLAGRRGKKRALVAVSHSILVILYYLLKEGSQYADLGIDFFDRLEPQRLTRYYLERLQHLGHEVTLDPRVTRLTQISGQVG